MKQKPIEIIVTDLNGEIESYKKVLLIKDTEISNYKVELNKLRKSLIYQSELNESLRAKMDVYFKANARLQEQKANLEMQLSQRKKNWIQRWLD